MTIIWARLALLFFAFAEMYAGFYLVHLIPNDQWWIGVPTIIVFATIFVLLFIGAIID